MSTGTTLRNVDDVRIRHVTDILRRYPDVDDVDRETVLLFLRQAPPPDNALLAGIAAIGPQLAAFRADHRRALGSGRRHILHLALVVALGLATILLLWDRGTTPRQTPPTAGPAGEVPSFPGRAITP